MRIGWLVENTAPFVADEVAALRERGVEVTVAAVFRPSPRVQWREAYGAEVLYPERGARAWAAWALSGDPEIAARLPALVRRARLEGAPGRLVALAAGLARRARREGWQHLHGSFATFPAWVAAAAAQLAELPFSFTGHAYDVQQPRRWLPRLVADASFVRAISRETALRLRRAAPHAEARDRIRVSYLGVDASRFASACATPADPAELLCVANLGPTKGIEVLVDAAALLAARGRRFVVRVLGEGPLRGPLERRIAARGLAERVRLEGKASRDEVARALRRATLFVLPCVLTEDGRRHDGLPVALLEALAAGRAVVTTPVGGIPEAVAPARVARLAAPGDSVGLAAALDELLARPELRRRLGSAARVEALRRFRIEASVDRLVRWIGETAEWPASRTPAAPAFPEARAHMSPTREATS